MKQLTIVKIGGNIIDHADRLDGFCKQFQALDGYKILVHGGGKIATDIGRKLGIEAKYIDGRRITDAETLELVTMVYGGLVNKTIVGKLQHCGADAIGLTGADGHLIAATKRPVGATDYGYVGDVMPGGINTNLLTLLLQEGFIPVVAPLSYEHGTGMLNTNADTIAGALAKAMSATLSVTLIYCFEQPGVLYDVNDPASVIPLITAGNFGELRSTGIVSAGMIPKLENALQAVSQGVKNVIIGQAEDLNSLVAGVIGTTIRA
jgi:acetylglutamate kinase